MNKLLLLATSLISLTIQSQGATLPPHEEAAVKQANYNDSIQRANPKGAFRNLFESEDGENASGARLNPKAISFVEDYMEENNERLTRMKSWGKPYFDLIGAVFARHKLPVELKYLSVIESDLKSGAVSWAGAVGPWQFMAGTARQLGLKVTGRTDERRDYNKSTVAAAKYLKELYSIYHDWLLVIAAYNCGPGNVNVAIRKSGSRDFWNLQYHLPAESRNHVKKFIATHYIMEGDVGLTTLTRRETENLKPEAAVFVNNDPSVTVLTVSGKYAASAIADALQMNPSAFSQLNPNFDKSIAANGSYELRLPNEKVEPFQAARQQILEQSIRTMLMAGR